MSRKSVLILCIITAAASVAVTRFYFPQIQTKTVETTKEVIHNDVKTIIKTVTEPNGTTTSTTTIEDHTQKIDTSKKLDITTTRKDWLVSGSYSTDLHKLEPIYGLQVNRRILGPAYVGALLNTKGEVGLSIGLEF